jgi:AcrR family transcriptional regulator
MGTSRDSELTKKKLVEAAGQLFAEKGFKKVTVREIVKKADTHLSAMNYHFSSKDMLYKEVLETACSASSFAESDKEALRNLSPKDSLVVATSESIKHNRLGYAQNWKYILVAKEYSNPSKFYDSIVQEHANTDIYFICELIARALDTDIDSSNVTFLALSWVGLVELFGSYDHIIKGYNAEFDETMMREDKYASKIVDLLIQD